MTDQELLRRWEARIDAGFSAGDEAKLSALLVTVEARIKAKLNGS